MTEINEWIQVNGHEVRKEWRGYLRVSVQTINHQKIFLMLWDHSVDLNLNKERKLTIISTCISLDHVMRPKATITLDSFYVERRWTGRRLSQYELLACAQRKKIELLFKTSNS